MSEHEQRKQRREAALSELGGFGVQVNNGAGVTTEELESMAAVFARRDDREIVHRFRVQPGLNVAIEDSLNILLEVTRPDGINGTEVIVRSDILGDIDHLKNMLDLARVWVVAAEDDANAKRMAELREKTAPRRHPRSGQTA